MTRTVQSAARGALKNKRRIPGLWQVFGSAAIALLCGANPVLSQSWQVPEGPSDAGQSYPDRPIPDFETPFNYTGVLKSAVDQAAALKDLHPDPEALALSLMLDPRAAFAMFRDDIVTEAYQGHLRDAEAVLEAGAGNDHDKAKALADVLGLMGYDTRLVAAPRPPELAERIAQDTCRNAGQNGQAIWKVAGLGPAVMSRVSYRAQANFAALSGAVSPPQNRVETINIDADERHHIWIQMRQGADWVDLDPALPETKFGQAPAGTGQVLDDPVDAHQVQFILKIERLKDGTLHQNEILRHALDVPTSVETPVSLIFGPETKGMGGILNETLGGMQGQTAGMVATLLIGQEMRKSQVFAAPGVAATAGTFLDGEQDEIVTALSLTVASTAPGQPDRDENRVIFDLVPAQIRRDAAGGATISTADLNAPEMGLRYPSSLESLRQFVIGNGGLSAHLAAVRMMGVLLDLPLAVQMAKSGTTDSEATIWASWVQASTIALASEALIRARPALDGGGCAKIDRPRVLTWGIGSTTDGASVHWLDWTLDEIIAAGQGSADRAWQMRLWHGALQGALETEALMTHLGAPNGTIPVSLATLTPQSRDAVTARGTEALEDASAGYTILVSQDLAEDEWWRANALTGQSDARVAFGGNGRRWVPRPGDGSSRRGISNIDKDFADRILGGPDDVAQDILEEALEELAEIERKEKAARGKRSSGGNEYLIVLFNVSIPASTAAGVAVGSAVLIGLLYVMFG